MDGFPFVIEKEKTDRMSGGELIMSDHLNLKEQVCFSLYNAQRQVNRYYSNKIFKKYKLTYPQFLVLEILWDQSPVNVKKSCNRLSP